MKKILILTAGFGEGHNTAARSIREAVDAVAPGEAKAEVLDLFDASFGRFNKLAQKAYLAMINNTPNLWGKVYEALDSTPLLEWSLYTLGKVRRLLAQILEEQKPHAVVSTYPVYNFLLDQIYAEKKPRDFLQITVVTDSITVNSVWHRPSSDCFVVANDATAEVMRRARVPAEKIRVLGFPVTPRFAANRGDRPPPSSAAFRVLYMINFGKREAPDLVRRLIQVPGIDLTVTVGRDEALRAQVEKVIADSPRPVEIFGWTGKMPDLVMRSHLLISKAGGATVQEAVAAKTPMIISQVVPGQEEGNAHLIVDNECGALAETHEGIAQICAQASENDGALCKKWMANIAKLSKPDAAQDIARFILAPESRVETNASG